MAPAPKTKELAHVAEVLAPMAMAFVPLTLDWYPIATLVSDEAEEFVPSAKAPYELALAL